MIWNLGRKYDAKFHNKKMELDYKQPRIIKTNCFHIKIKTS